MTQHPDVPQHITAKALAERVRSASAKFNLVFLLDYDGTLTPIVDRPGDAHLADDTRQVLCDLSARYPVAIISGRERPDVEDRVALKELYYAGSHGLDIAGPADHPIEFVEGDDFIPEVKQAIAFLEQRLTALSGVLVEGKTFSVAIHTRLAADDDVPTVEEVVAETLAKHPRLRTKAGKRVIELIPDIDWNKGRAAEWLIQGLQPAHDPIFPVFLGDDQTDEDAFAVLPENGLGVLVARQPRPSNATVRLTDPSDVVDFLEKMTAVQT